MHPDRIFLIGYRGTGKTTAGRLVAGELGWAFVDADDVTEAAAGRPIRDIFAAEGEQGFRDREAATLAELARRKQHVVATGGGAVLRPANRELLTASGFVAWLTAPPETVWQRMLDDPTTAARRPTLTTGGLAEAAGLIAAREPLYAATADAVVPTDGRSPEQVAAAILAAWRAARSLA